MRSVFLRAAFAAKRVSILVSVDSVFEDWNIEGLRFSVVVSILVSVDSVFEAKRVPLFGTWFICFNPSFCGFGI